MLADLWVTLTVVAFFALCWGLVVGCDRIIGPDDESDLAAYNDDNETIDNPGDNESAGAAR